jgi:prephenate dehydrogenase
MAAVQVGILGLGRLGQSIGLALKRAQKANPKQQFIIAGYDVSPATRIEAQRRKAVDSAAGSPHEAAAGRQVVIMTMPYADVREAYRMIGPVLGSGSVVLDFSPLTRPSMEWAAKYLPSHAYQINVTAVLNPAYLFYGLETGEYAREDLFDKGMALVMPSPGVPKEVVELASDLAELLGAEPRFTDPLEHDGISAATEGVPALLGTAAFYALRGLDGWDDAKRAANPNFARLTHHLADTHPDDIRDLLLNNREAMIRQIDAITDTLGALRGALAAGDSAALEEALVSSRDAYDEWLARRRQGDWGDKPEDTERGGGEMWLSSLLGGYLTKKIRGEK